MEFMTLMKTITVMRERFMADVEEIREQAIVEQEVY